jgi:hypothetical protein
MLMTNCGHILSDSDDALFAIRYSLLALRFIPGFRTDGEQPIAKSEQRVVVLLRR